MKKCLGICLSLLALASVAAKSKKEVPTQPLKQKTSPWIQGRGVVNEAKGETS
jgi:hypothetical protein